MTLAHDDRSFEERAAQGTVEAFARPATKKRCIYCHRLVVMRQRVSSGRWACFSATVGSIDVRYDRPEPPMRQIEVFPITALHVCDRVRTAASKAKPRTQDSGLKADATSPAPRQGELLAAADNAGAAAGATPSAHADAQGSLF